MIVKKLSRWTGFITGLVLLAPAIVSAHVIVTPGQAGVGQELVFSVSSPNERQTPIVELTLDIPRGVSDILPTVAPGWTVTTESDGSSSDPTVTAITWSKGQIPVGQRADFSFGAQVPGNATSLDWKAYQTYADGTVVHWDQKPSGSDDAVGTAGPYSVTKVVNDLTPTTTTSSSNTPSLVIAVVALIVAVAAWLKRTTR
ncbi:MAG TPA: DUF1775 domain-containing protein [Candidatus Saccharimonadales bacterium]|nr:DUF1775 domain-containing protein [Candidatus Saccharimonadales bacterium]